MKRYEIEQTGEHWEVIDRTSGLPFKGGSAGPQSRLEAQALADLRNGLDIPTRDKVRSRLSVIRLTWRAIVGQSR